MIRLIYLVSSLKQTGPINQAFNLITGFDRDKISPLIVTLFQEDKVSSWIDKYRENGIEVKCLKSNHSKLKDAAKKLDIIIAERSISVVHSSGLSADTVNKYLRSKVLKVTTIRSHKDDLGEKKNFLIKKIIQYKFLSNIKSLDVPVACSYSLRKDILKEIGLECECVQNGVDIDHFVPVVKKEKKTIREHLELPSDKLIYLTVGVLYRRKQTKNLAKAFLSASIHNAVLVIVGDGEEYAELKLIAKDNHSIILTGKKKDPYLYYQCADIFVSASQNEGLPNSVLEAMACGIPVILSDIGPHKEILDKSNNAGVSYPCGNNDCLSNSLALSAKWDLGKMSENALLTIKNEFSKYITANNYYNIYKKYLKNG